MGRGEGRESLSRRSEPRRNGDKKSKGGKDSEGIKAVEGRSNPQRETELLTTSAKGAGSGVGSGEVRQSQTLQKGRDKSKDD